MDIKKIDKNFDTSFTLPQDAEWFNVLEQPFSIHGVFYSKEEGLFRRVEKEVAEATNPGVEQLSKHTAGGRIRFITNSPYVVFRVEETFETPFSHMTIAGKCGVTLFANNKFSGTVMPSYEQIATADPNRGGNSTIVYDGIKYPFIGNGEEYLAEIYMPLYSPVKSFHVGLKKGCTLKQPTPYKHTAPVLFYGSSITQGGCASKTCDDYVNRLCRMLNTEILNLGFSGSAKAEQVMADYIASKKPSVFVLDYDHNAPDAEHLKNTHFNLYQTVRKANPTTPIIIMTMPTIEGYQDRPYNAPRREQIFNSYNKAKQLGDDNLYIIDCYGCFGESTCGECGTVDDCHPDSLGFLRMAERIYPILNKLLNNK